MRRSAGRRRRGGGALCRELPSRCRPTHVPRPVPLPRGAAPAGPRLHQLRVLAAPFRDAGLVPDVPRCPPRRAGRGLALPRPRRRRRRPGRPTGRSWRPGAWRFWNEPVEGIGPNGYLLQGRRRPQRILRGRHRLQRRGARPHRGPRRHRRPVRLAPPFLRGAVAAAGALRPGAGPARGRLRLVGGAAGHLALGRPPRHRPRCERCTAPPGTSRATPCSTTPRAGCCFAATRSSSSWIPADRRQRHHHLRPQGLRARRAAHRRPSCGATATPSPRSTSPRRGRRSSRSANSGRAEALALIDAQLATRRAPASGAAGRAPAPRSVPFGEGLERGGVVRVPARQRADGSRRCRPRPKGCAARRSHGARRCRGTGCRSRRFSRRSSRNSTVCSAVHAASGFSVRPLAVSPVKTKPGTKRWALTLHPSSPAQGGAAAPR